MTANGSDEIGFFLWFLANGELTAGPDVLCACATSLPAKKMTLHVPVEISSRTFHQFAIVGYIEPFAKILKKVSSCTSQDDAAVRPRDHVVVLNFREPHQVAVFQLWCI